METTPDPFHSRVAARFDAPPVTRFAPSPTGYLHLGHVVNALYVWGVAQGLGGRVLLRLEDDDRTRCRPQYQAAIVEDLAWLGFIPAPDSGQPAPDMIRQSDRHEIYAAALERLRAAYHVYACDCSRTDIGGERYRGRCRNRGVGEHHGAGLRVQLADGAEGFDDLLLGPQEQSPADQCGDLLIRDRDGHWTYQFAVVSDDLHQGVTLVVRGADLVGSTGRQRLLSRMLMTAGAFPPRPLPIYLHHALVFGEDGRKLSKSTRATGVRAMRHRGLSPSEVIGQAAAAVGLTRVFAPIAAHDVGALFRPHIGDTECTGGLR